MAIKTKSQALASIHQSCKPVAGVRYKVWTCYLGTDPVSHRKIKFMRSSRKDVEDAVTKFYEAFLRGLSPADARDLDSRQLLDARLARRVLDEAGHSDVPLVEAARVYCRSEGLVKTTRLADAFEQYLESFPPVQEAHRKNISARVGAAVAALGGKRAVSDITTDEVRRYLDSRFGALAPKTWNNNMLYLKTFFSWCARKDRLFCASNPLEPITPKTIAAKEPEFVTAPVVARIFALALSHPNEEVRRQWIWQLALSFFNGVRTDEIIRLRVKDVNLDEGEVRVATPKGFQHGIAPRMVELSGAAKAWLEAYPLLSGQDGDDNDRLLPSARNTNGVISWVKARAAASGAPIKIPNNAGRHSFITMHVALYKDPRRTEALVGTSKTMRERSYMGLATKQQAEAYFGAVRPHSPMVEAAISNNHDN